MQIKPFCLSHKCVLQQEFSSNVHSSLFNGTIYKGLLAFQGLLNNGTIYSLYSFTNVFKDECQASYPNLN